nr:uncharacterized protein LOC118086178 isoform X1 [Zootoca vivipara]
METAASLVVWRLSSEQPLVTRMSASDRVVVVLGGAGTVGSGIVKVLLEKGFQVAVISRDRSRLEKLKQFLPPSACQRLHTLVGDVGSEEGAEAAKEALLKSTGKVTDVVSSLGFSWWQGGPPLTQTLKELHRVLDTLLLSTFTAWKAFFPLVKDNTDGTYTFITGGAGERLLMPGTGFLTLGAAGALAFSLMVREEYPDVPCKLNEVSAGFVGRSASSLPTVGSNFALPGLQSKNKRRACWIRPQAHLVQHPVLTAAPVGNLQAAAEHKSTLRSCSCQQLEFRILPPAIEAEH